jgi:hypothetical protein
MDLRLSTEELYKFIDKFASWIYVDGSVMVDGNGNRKGLSVGYLWGGGQGLLTLHYYITPPNYSEAAHAAVGGPYQNATDC